MAITQSYNIAKGKNPAYLVAISCPTEGLEVICDLPEQIVMAMQSDWEARMPPGLESLRDNAIVNTIGVAPMSQEWSTRQMWVNSSPQEFSLTLLFDANSDAYKDVFLPAMSLYRLTAPVAYGDLLLPPGPSRIDKKKNAVTIAIGKMIRIEDAILVSAQPSFDTRLDIQGYPIACEIELTIRTAVVYSRTNIDTMISRSSES